MQEKDLIEKIRGKEEGAMEVLLRCYGPLFRYILGPIVPQQDREACLMEVAMRVWEKIDTFDPQRGSWTGWLTAVCRNTALNYLRQKQWEALPEDAPSPEPTPEERVLQRERREALGRALQQLTVGERRLFFRKYYYLQSTRQIASELGTTERAVEGKLYRIKKKLKKWMGGEGYDGASVSR